jgi:hypothetical protein
MTSHRKLEANRLNAQASTGPQTAGGKIRSSQNALKHGLAVPASRHPATAALVRGLAGELINGSEGSLLSMEVAFEVAQTQVDLLRIRHLRSVIMGTLLEQPASSGAGSAELVQQLARLDRYERRTLSRRKALLREVASDHEAG